MGLDYNILYTVVAGTWGAATDNICREHLRERERAYYFHNFHILGKKMVKMTRITLKSPKFT
jgi:hypothetical protein